MRVERVRYRDNPTLTCALMADGAANEAGLFWAALRSAGIWADLQKLGVPGIKGVWSIPEAAGWGITVVSIKQMYAGHAPQVMALAAQCTAGAYFGKYVIVVDEDVDPTNVNQVLWAMATRSRPAQSIDILRETWSTYLDPSLNPPEIRPWGSKCLINACMDYRFIKTFSKRTKLSKEAYENVVARWQELGLSGTPPVDLGLRGREVLGECELAARAAVRPVRGPMDVRRADAANLGAVLPSPANGHKYVVGVRPSLGDQAIALGFSIGGRVAVIHPQQVGAGPADGTLSQLCEPIVTGRHGCVPQAVASSRTAPCAGTAGTSLIPFSSLLRRWSNPLLSSART